MRYFIVLILTLFFTQTAISATDDRGLAVNVKNRDSRKRVALIIGNGSYRFTDSLPKLANPVNDADDMAAALRRFGFEVIAKKNLTKEEMDETITDFGRKIADSDAALFYYAGHGLQVKGQNYIVPVDANIDSEAKVPYRAVNVNQLLEEMESSRSRVNIVMLDACRNNPISGKFRSGASRGLAPPASMPKGTVIVFATDPGNVAADGSGRNGLFTAGLLDALKGNDLTLGGVLYTASKHVQEATGQQQTPYVNGPTTVQREFSFVSASNIPNVKPPTTQPKLIATISAPVAQSSSPINIEMVNVPGGCFQMGDFVGDGLKNEKPPHKVCLNEFSISKFTVTQKLWEKIMDNNPSYFKQCGENCPVETVSWNDVQEFIKNLNSRTGQSYRLPTEAEWEYACRSGGKEEKFCGGNELDVVAWYGENSGITLHPVGQNKPNGLGIYDMSGNVWEWVQDFYSPDYYTSSPQENPQGPIGGENHVLRGGSCFDKDAWQLKSTSRNADSPERAVALFGFRLASPVPVLGHEDNKATVPNDSEWDNLFDKNFGPSTTINSSTQKYAGFRFQAITSDLAKAFGLNEVRGALISEVIKKSPADNAGLLSGDIILEYDGKLVSDTLSLSRYLANSSVSSRVKLLVFRTGKEIILSMGFEALNP